MSLVAQRLQAIKPSPTLAVSAKAAGGGYSPCISDVLASVKIRSTGHPAAPAAAGEPRVSVAVASRTRSIVVTR